MKTAELLRDVDTGPSQAGECVQRCYALSEPLDGYRFVVVSALHHKDGPETYIFPSDDKGEIFDWGELTGSYRGGTDHAEALRRAGYVIRQASPTYTRADLVRAILGQQWAVACSHIVSSGCWSVDLEWPGRELRDIGAYAHHHRPDGEPVRFFFLVDGVNLSDLPSPDDVVTAMEQV